jgi:lantibiotic transport system permease protein
VIATFGRAVWSEWLKRRRSLTTWVVVGSAGFVPAIVFAARFRNVNALPGVYRNPEFWPSLWVQTWESMALLILPLSVMLMVSLITQIEDRSNGWKQLHAAPLPLAVIFLAKLAVVLFLVAELVGAFVLCIYLAGIGPAVLLASVDRPVRPFPLIPFAWRAAAFFVDVLPIVALQYLLALRFRTFLAPLGLGMALWILSIGAIRWHYSFLIPYAYLSLDYLVVEYHRPLPVPASPTVIAAGCFFVFTSAAYAVYALRRDKG